MCIPYLKSDMVLLPNIVDVIEAEIYCCTDYYKKSHNWKELH